MNCTEFDWKAYSLEELTGEERQRAETHLAGCAACQEEVDGLALTLTALRALPEAEPPRRIAFVSDKVFEPAWWQRFLSPHPRWAMATAALLAAAILAHGWMSRPVAGPAPAMASIDEAAVEQRVGQAVSARLEAAVAQAVGEARARDLDEVKRLLADTEKRFQLERAGDLVAVEEELRLFRGQLRSLYVTTASLGN